ncbi:MAG: hypothetical protein ACT4OS_06705 [Acidimicrobiales bacterium]
MLTELNPDGPNPDRAGSNRNFPSGGASPARTRRHRVAASGLAALVVTMVLVVVAPPARACSCLPATEPELFAIADAVFIGRLVSAQPVDEFAVELAWEVSSIFKGSVTYRQGVETGLNSAACGLSADVGSTYLVLANAASEPDVGPTLAASLCGGTRAAVPGERPAGFPAARRPDDAPPSSADPPTTRARPGTSLAPATTAGETATTGATATTDGPGTTLAGTATTQADDGSGPQPDSSSPARGAGLALVAAVGLTGLAAASAFWFRRRSRPDDSAETTALEDEF